MAQTSVKNKISTIKSIVSKKGIDKKSLLNKVSKVGIRKVKQEQIIGLKEFRLDVEKYSKKIAQGASFIVVKRSKPIFLISQVKEKWETILDMHDEGGVPIDDFITVLSAQE